ncbi:hypothetical protein IFU01_18515 [Oxalobacteraceae sp. CFBP 8763]|nr:hypothetical protein [Oxalobacteraceae sp. CFBP 8763]
MLDDAGNKVKEIHGVPEDANGNIKAWAFSGTLVVHNDITFGTFENDQKKTVMMGTMADMLNHFDAGNMALSHINSQRLAYVPLPSESSASHNSNGAFSTVGKAMNVPDREIADFSGADPGKGKISLGDSIINFIHDFFGIGGGSTSGPYQPTWPENLTVDDGEILASMLNEHQSDYSTPEAEIREHMITLIGVESNQLVM